MSLTIYDGVMAGLVVLGMIWGAWRGVVWQVAGLASLIVGYSVAHPASAQLAPHLPGEPVVARALGMLIVYAAVSAAIFAVAWMIRAALRRLRFEAFDRHLGMVLGGLLGALVGLIGTLFVVSLAPETRAPVFGSPTGRLVGRVMDVVGPALPGEARQVLSPFWNGGTSPESPTLVQDSRSDVSAEPGTDGWWGRVAGPAERRRAEVRGDLDNLRERSADAIARSIRTGDPGGLRDVAEAGRDRLRRRASDWLDDLTRSLAEDKPDDARPRRR
jgi:uncharacterized membrane protein required for colicin V production